MWKAIISVVGLLCPIVLGWLVGALLKPLEDDVQKVGGGLMTALGKAFDDPSILLWVSYSSMILFGMAYGFAFAKVIRMIDEQPTKLFKELENKLWDARNSAEFFRGGGFDQVEAVDRMGVIETAFLKLEDMGLETPYNLPWQTLLASKDGRDALFVHFSTLCAYSEEGRLKEAKASSKNIMPIFQKISLDLQKSLSLGDHPN